jgi:hypothetical protein
MIQAGWQKSGVASTDSVSVSTWRKTSGDTPLQATLLIVNALGSDTRRDLTITVSQEAIAGGGFPGAPPYPVVLTPQTTIAFATAPTVPGGSKTTLVKKKLKKVSTKK